MVTSALATPTLTAFPKAEVTATLFGELMEAAKTEAQLHGITLPSTPDAIASVPIEIDSIVAVAILCSLDGILGVKLPENLVRSGGYSSVSDALGHLLPRIESFCTKKHGAKS